jgi:hypothetical protein
VNKSDRKQLKIFLPFILEVIAFGISAGVRKVSFGDLEKLKMILATDF